MYYSVMIPTICYTLFKVWAVYFFYILNTQFYIIYNVIHCYDGKAEFSLTHFNLFKPKPLNRSDYHALLSFTSLFSHWFVV